MKRGRKPRTVPDARAWAMRDLYLMGQTLEDIGQSHGVTRERVRQIITRHFGKLSKVGGKSKAVEIARKERLVRLAAEAMEKWGCTVQQYAILKRMGAKLVKQGVGRARTPIGAYLTQRKNARMRGIPWELNLWQWWLIWQKSGKWSRRGLRRGQFVMCRKGDKGPYAADNVFIALSCENLSAGTRKDTLPVGVFRHNAGYTARTKMNGVVTRLGVFDTPEEAHIAYLKSLHREAA